MADIRELIFQKNGSDKVTAGIYTDSDGIVSGIPAALKKAEETGLSVTYAVHEGEEVFAGDMLMEFSGIPTQICTAVSMTVKKSFRSKAAMKTATSSGKLLLPFTPAQTLFMWTVEKLKT
jgi:nicotinate-nucleotide pyrophosphorylase